MSAQRGLTPLIIVFLMLGCLAFGAGGYYIYSNYQINPKTETSKNSGGNLLEKIPFVSDQQIAPKSATLEGKITKLDKDLGLISETSYEKENNMIPSVVYYSAGTYTSGQYKDYTRYIAVRGAIDPSGAAIYTFASKDGQKYILDKSTLPITDTTDSIEEIDKSKIEKIENLPGTHPKILKLDNTFALNINNIPVKSEKTGKKDKYGNDDYIEIINFDALTNPALTSPLSSLTLKADKDIPGNNAGLTADVKAAMNYLDGFTMITAFDSTGLPYTYDLTRPKLASEYPAKYEKYSKELTAYMASTDQNKVYPEFPLRPNLRLEKSEITTTNSIYDKYDIAMPPGCAMSVDTRVAKNITEADLSKIGTSSDGDLFILKDKSHPLNKFQYQMKVGDVDKEGFVEVNKIQKPTYDSYVTGNPLLFLKDYWGRWVILGEYDIKLIGGCGKPVLYLYPEKSTEVSVKFLNPINFDLTIPTYKNSWKVLANPSGLLTDLQPELTDCSKIDATKLGSEYAKEACQSKTYPYLYWAGQVTGNSYPKIDGGWIVEKNNLENFLTGKLEEVGFNQTEKNDFLSYWVPELLSKNSAFYKIAFIQTAELNKMVPMRINPAPKSAYRIFMDWSALSEKPAFSLEPQKLNKVARDGFTLVEWGGLKR